MLLKHNNITELENATTLTDISKYATKCWVKSMPSLHAAGRKHLLNDDKELAYSYFFRYMSLLQMIVKSPDYNANTSKKDLADAPYVIGKLEELKNELINIYKSKEMVTSLNGQDDEIDEDYLVEASSSTDTVDILVSPAICLNNVYWIGIDRLLECVKSSKNKFSYIIYDTRSVEEFNSSHLQRDLNNVNIPMSTLPNGTSATMLENLLTGEAKEKWIMRGSYQFIILLGSNDTPDSKTHSVLHLYDIINKWDPNTTYFHQPIILEGGYMHISFTYPIYCTAAVRSTTPKEHDQLSLNDIEYPNSILDDMDDSTVSSSGDAIKVVKVLLPKITTPNFDRSKKPLSHIIEAAVPMDQGEPALLPPVTGAPVSQQKPEKPAKVLPVMHMETRSYSNSCRLALENSFKSNHDLRSNNTSTCNDQRGVKTFSTLPSYDRSKKPKIGTKPIVNVNRYDPIRRTGRDLISGYCGLQNGANYCYINSVIQCLFHIKDFKDYLLQGTYLNHLNRNSRSAGEISQELASMCEVYYSGEFSSISSKNIKRAVGNINPRFANNTQEDCHEFFMILLHYLHEELSYHIAIPENARESEIKFIEYMNHFDSFINRNFFGQSESRVRCHRCGYVSSTFTPFGCLTVEIAGTTLEECISEHYCEEEVEDFRCERCHQKGLVTKKTNIYRPPNYLTIHLKRFKGAGLRSYHKKTDRVGFRMSLALPCVSNDRPRNADYHLVGICIHSGTLDSGHYKAYVDSESNNNWVLFDDARIIPLGSLLSHIRSITRDIYMLFYKRVAQND